MSNRTFYNLERVFASRTGSEYFELLRVQSASSSFNTRRSSSYVAGGQKAYSTNVHQLLSATVNFEYVGYEAYNEDLLGIKGNFLENILDEDNVNFNIQVLAGGSVNVTGAVLTNYNISASISDYPRHRVSFETFEMGFTPETTVTEIQDYPTGMAAILPGNIEMQVIGACGINTFLIQDFNLSASINRTYSTYAGEKIPTEKRVTFPVEANMNVSAYLSEFGEGNINDYFDSVDGVDIRVIYKDKTGANTLGGFELTNVFLQSQELSNETMNRTMLNLEFGCTLGVEDSKNEPKGILYIGI